jgi:hypothetical protein
MSPRQNAATTDSDYDVALQLGFTALFKWHFDRGTRAGLTMQAHGNSWDPKEFSKHVKTEIRNAQNWYNGTSAPKGLFKMVENAFFGDPGQLATDPYAQWRADLRAAHKKDRTSRDGSPDDANQEVASRLSPPAPTPIQGTFADTELHAARAINTKSKPTIIKAAYTVAGSAGGLLAQGIVVAAHYSITGDSLQSVVGLLGAYALPVTSLILGGIMGFCSAPRVQRRNNTVPSEL